MRWQQGTTPKNRHAMKLGQFITILLEYYCLKYLPFHIVYCFRHVNTAHCSALKIVGSIQYRSWYKARTKLVFHSQHSQRHARPRFQVFFACELKTYTFISVRCRDSKTSLWTQGVLTVYKRLQEIMQQMVGELCIVLHYMEQKSSFTNKLMVSYQDDAISCGLINIPFYNVNYCFIETPYIVQYRLNIWRSILEGCKTSLKAIKVLIIVGCFALHTLADSSLLRTCGSF